MAKTTRDASAILGRLTGDDPELREMIAEEAVHAQVARMVYDARTAARLSYLLADSERCEPALQQQDCPLEDCLAKLGANSGTSRPTRQCPGC